MGLQRLGLKIRAALAVRQRNGQQDTKTPKARRSKRSMSLFVIAHPPFHVAVTKGQNPNRIYRRELNPTRLLAISDTVQRR